MLIVFTASVCVCVPASSCFCPLFIEDWMQLLMWRQQTKETAIRIQNRDFTTSLITSKGILHWNSAPVGLEGGSVKFWACCFEEDWSKHLQCCWPPGWEQSVGMWRAENETGNQEKINCSDFAYTVLLWYMLASSCPLCVSGLLTFFAFFLFWHLMFWSVSPLILFWQQQVIRLWRKPVDHYVSHQSSDITRTRCMYEFVNYLQNSLRIQLQINFFDHESKETIGRTSFL